jgi:hypothetical protein
MLMFHHLIAGQTHNTKTANKSLFENVAVKIFWSDSKKSKLDS